MITAWAASTDFHDLTDRFILNSEIALTVRHVPYEI